MFLAEMKKEVKRTRQHIVNAGFDLTQLTLRARINHWLCAFGHVLDNWLYLPQWLEETTPPGATYRTYARRK